MKRTLLYMISLLLVAGLIISCSNPNSDKEKDEDTAPKEEMVLSDEESTDGPPCPTSTTLDWSIVSQRQQAFQNLPDDHLVPKGFQLCAGDAKGILESRNDQEAIYAIYGYDAELDEVELIFVVDNGLAQKTYFDFTKPCPSFCPPNVFPWEGEQPTKASLNGNTGYYFAKNGISGVLSGTGDTHDTFLMLKGTDPDGSIYLIDCELDCSYQDSGSFAPCDDNNPCPDLTT
ncbi:MAG: hypothetical protein AAFY71_17245 [Bacteroidota bacterium]